MTTVQTSNPWVKCFQPNPHAKLRLFCFPYAGGGASLFRLWSSGLPPDVEVCPIQLPGREDRLRESPFTELSNLVHILTPILHPYLDLPFALFGHSMGALIGFEVARQLQAQQAPMPVRLFVSGRRAPHLGDRNPSMHSLPDDEFWQEICQLNGTATAVLENAELKQLLLPTLRADFRLCNTYTYLEQPPLTCPISVFGGTADPEAPEPLLQGWQQQTCSQFLLQKIPGDHFFLHSQRQRLLEYLTLQLAMPR